MFEFINSSLLTVGLSHHHGEVFNRSVGVAEPAAVDSEVDGRFADQHILFVHTDMWRWWRRAWKRGEGAKKGHRVLSPPEQVREVTVWSSLGLCTRECVITASMKGSSSSPEQK